MRKTLAAAVLAILSVSSLAFAQDHKWTKSDDCALQRARNPKAVCELKIEGDEVEGRAVGPDGHQLLARTQAKQVSLIRYRTDFLDRIVASTEQR